MPDPETLAKMQKQYQMQLQMAGRMNQNHLKKSAATPSSSVVIPVEEDDLDWFSYKTHVIFFCINSYSLFSHVILRESLFLYNIFNEHYQYAMVKTNNAIFY